MGDTGEQQSARAATGNEGYRSAEGWNRGQAMLQGFMAPAIARMLEMCGLERGWRVLDVAAGTGIQTFEIAKRVGPEGYVLATDISGEMLEVVKNKAASAGDANIETEVMDGQDLEVADGAFDALICQFGLMLFPDPDKSLASMFKAVRAGGRIGIMVFGKPEGNPHLSVSASVTRKLLNLPPPEPGRPGHFSLGKSGLLESKMKSAGFADVIAETVTTEMRPNSVADFVSFLRDSGGGPSPMLAKADDTTKEAVWAAIVEALSPFEEDDECVFPGDILVAVATRP